MEGKDHIFRTLFVRRNLELAIGVSGVRKKKHRS
jgi:hypothetical protein